MRLVLPAFKHVRNGAELDRSLDVEEIDAALARIAKILNGGITEENFAAALKFAIGATAGTVQNAWEKTRSIVSLTGMAGNLPADLAGGVTSVILGVTGVSDWTPVEVSGLLLSDASAPSVTLQYGASALTAAITANKLTDAERSTFHITDATKTAYRFSCTSFLASSVPAGTLVRLSSTQPIYGVSTVTASFSASHIA